MNKLSWKQIQSLFPTESTNYNKEFSNLFAKLGKQELTAEDIDSVLKTPKKADFTRMIFDSVGQVIGRIETDDVGNSRCFNQIGAFMGSTFGGQTLNHLGEIVAQSDVLSSLLFREERMVASVGLDDLKTATQTDPFTGLSLDRKLTDEELSRAIRLDLEAELDAINLYSSHLEATDHEEAKKVLEHVIKEEKDHHVLFTGLINKLDPEQAEVKSDDYLEEVKEGSKKQAGGLEDFIVNWDASKDFRVKALEYAELRPETYDVTKWANLPKHIQRYIYLKSINVYTSSKKISRVVHKSDGWHVLSEEGKNLGGPYKTKGEATTRLKQVEHFKHQSFNLNHLKEAVGIDYTELEERAEDYVPVTQSRGKFKLYEIVNTPFGRGRIITRQTESKPYSYGVRITDTDEIEIVEEQEIKRTKKSVIVNREQTQQSYSLDSILGCDEEEKREGPVNLKDIIEEHEKVSISKMGVDTKWLRELWTRESKSVMDTLADKSPEFAEKYSTGHIPLHEEYSENDLKRVTLPYMEGSITKDQAEKLLRDLMYQFRSKLYLDYGLSPGEAKEDNERESYSKEDLPAYGSANQFPPSGTGAGVPSSSDLSRIVNDIPSRQIQVK